MREKEEERWEKKECVQRDRERREGMTGKI